MSNSSHAIGLFDSGVGGLTVMQELMQVLPNERLIYFGDTARVPYGNKSQETIIRYSIENTAVLLHKKIKLLIVACNTASALALPELQRRFSIPIIGVIEPGAAQAAAVTRNQRIAVLGTRATIQSGAYQTAIQKLLPKATIFPIACPLLVPLIEEHWLEHPATQLVIEEYLSPLNHENIDTLLLGCTHYPLLSHAIRKAIGNETIIVDSASTCAQQTKELLQQRGLLASKQSGPHKYYASDDPDKFRAMGERLFGNTLKTERMQN